MVNHFVTDESNMAVSSIHSCNETGDGGESIDQVNMATSSTHPCSETGDGGVLSIEQMCEMVGLAPDCHADLTEVHTVSADISAGSNEQTQPHVAGSAEFSNPELAGGSMVRATIEGGSEEAFDTFAARLRNMGHRARSRFLAHLEASSVAAALGITKK